MKRKIHAAAFLLFLLPLAMTGCGVGDWAAEKVGLKESDETKQERIVKMEEADSLVAKYADELSRDKAAGGGFVRQEGMKPHDPWGQVLEVSYEQDWTTERLTVRSLGPDGRSGTADDLVRVRETSNVSGVLSGIPWGISFVFVWVGLGILALLFSTLLNGGRSRKKRATLKKKNDARTYRRRRNHPVLSTLAICVLGPLSCLFYGFMLLGFGLTSVTGFDFDFFDDFDFGGFDFGDFGGGGGVDIDIDIF